MNVLVLALLGFFLLGYVVLEGFDLGVGIVLPILGRDDAERRLAIAAIAPYFLANEIWLIAAAGVLVAGFPRWEAALFPAVSPIVIALLVGWVLRDAGLWFRSRRAARVWRRSWDTVLTGGSLLVAAAWGVLIVTLVRGVPRGHHSALALGQLCDGLSLLGGALAIALFGLHGLAFAALRLPDPLRRRARRAVSTVVGAFVALAGVAAVWGGLIAGHAGAARRGLGVGLVVAAVAALAIMCGVATVRGARRLAFMASGAALVGLLAAAFVALYPYVLVARGHSGKALTLANAAADAASVGLIGWVTIAFLPLLLATQALVWWTFRRRVSTATFL